MQNNLNNNGNMNMIQSHTNPLNTGQTMNVNHNQEPILN